MQNKKLLVVFLILPFLLLSGWIGLILHQQSQGYDVVVRMTGYDPLDLLSGRYLRLRPDWTATDCGQFDGGKCPVDRFEGSYKYYLPEFDAKKLDSDLITKDVKVEMVFSYNKINAPLVRNLLLDGMDWNEWVAKEKQSVSQSAE